MRNPLHINRNDHVHAPLIHTEEAREDTPINHHLALHMPIDPSRRTQPTCCCWKSRRIHCSFPCLSTAQKRQRTWTLIIYALTTVFLFADQNLLSPNLSAAAKDFGFNDMERDEKLGGHIAIAFFLVGAPASFIVGCLADSRYIRRNLLFGSIVLIGEGACMATYFTRSYNALYATRAITGFSVGGALPVLSSVLGDWYPPEDRSSVMAFVGIGSGLGIAIGQGLSGMIGPKYGWRSPFLVISVPALALAILIMFTVKDPKRGEGDRIGFERRFGRPLVARRHNESFHPQLVGGSNNAEDSTQDNQHRNQMDISSSNQNQSTVSQPHSPISSHMEIDADNPYNKPNSSQKQVSASQNNTGSLRHCPKIMNSSHLQTTIALLKTPTVILIILQGTPGCIPWGIVNTYLNDYLSQDHGMTVQGATLTLLTFGIGNFVGMILSGVIGKYLYRKDVRYPCIFAGVMAALGSVPLWLMINYVDLNPTRRVSGWTWLWIFFVSFLSGTCSGVTGPIVKAMLQNVTLPIARGQAFAMLNTTDDFGRGLGPFFVSKLIQSLGGRQRAFNIGTLGWVLCGLFILCMYFTVRRDEERVQSILLDDFSVLSQSFGASSVIDSRHEESSFLLEEASNVEIPTVVNEQSDRVDKSH